MQVPAWWLASLVFPVIIKNMTHFFFKSLVAELITIALVTLTFILISNHLIAGRIAGSFFLLLGLFVCSKGFTSKDYRVAYSFKVGCLHLMLSLIMIITRIIHPEGSFADVNILGFIPGAIYHKISTIIYAVLITATATDLYQNKQKESLTKSL